MKPIAIAAVSFFCLAAAAIGFVGAPVTMVAAGALSSLPSPSGFGQNGTTLLLLSMNSLGTSVGGAALALGLSLVASALTLTSRLFSRFYRTWLVALLLTNPIFLVLGWSMILVGWPPFWAVLVATAYVVLPLGGLIVQSAFDEFPRVEIRAARSLGATPLAIVMGHLLPASAMQIALAGLLMSVYALGFYLLPTFVGLGRVSTLSGAISSLSARVGDWAGAQQLAAILLLMELGALLVFVAFRYLLRTRGASE